MTQLTPRDVDGIESEEVPRWRVLPASTNPRDGWKATLGGQHDQKILEDLNRDTVLHKSVLRTKHGFIREELRDFVDPLEVSPQKKEKIPARDDLVAENIEGEVDEFVEDPLSVKVVVKNVVHEAQPIGFTSEEELYDDAYDTILDCREVLDHIGVPNKRQVHDLQLRSAYETYGPAGEPIYTSSLPFQNEGGGVECEDYIFYSGETLQATKVLSIPLLCTLVGDTPLESICCNDLNSVAPFECVKTLFDLRLHKFYTTLSKGDEDDLGGDTRNRAGSVAKEADIDYLLMDSFRNASKPPARYKINEAKRLLKDALAKSNRVMNPIEGEVVAPTRGNSKDTFWGGRWTPFPTTNLRRNHRFLPNDSFCSSHIALVVEFSVESDLLVAQWKF